MINRIRRLSVLVLLCVVSAVSPSWALAQTAGLMLFPTRFVLDASEKTVSVDVVNKGDATGSYRIELIDMKMPEDAAIRQLEAGESDPYSLKKFTRISPRRTVLKPDDVQKVRILIRRPKDLPDGEYRSHLKVTLTENNLDNVEEQKPKANVAIQIKSRLAFTIPIIVRQGETFYRVGIEEADLFYGDMDASKEAPMLNILFGHEGNRSSIGDIKVTHIDPRGVNTVVNFHPGVAIYRGADRRRIKVPLTLPEGVNLGAGKLHITYTEREDEGGNLIAEKTVEL